MTAILITSLFVLAAGGFLLVQVAGRHRTTPSASLTNYLFYLLCWYLLVFYMAVYLLAPRFLPEESHYGYLLFNSIFVIPLHVGVAFFFTALSFNLRGGRIPLWLGICLICSFLAILISYSIDVAVKLSADTAPQQFTHSAPLSIVLMFVILLSNLVYIFFIKRKLAPGLTHDIRLFAAYLFGGLVVGLAFVFSMASFIDSNWQIGLSIAVMAGVNIPAWYPLSRLLKASTPVVANAIVGADLSMVKERYGISAREQEVIALVIKGKSNKEIENVLCISAETVKKHIYNIYRKVGVKNRVQLMNATLATGDPAENQAE